MTADKPLFFSFALLDSQFNDLLSKRADIILHIAGIHSDIAFISSYDTERKEEQFYKNAHAQIEHYKEDLKAVLSQIDDVHTHKNKALSSIYDQLNHFKALYRDILTHRQKVVYIAKERDLNPYITIDKRQSLLKSDLHMFLKRTYLKGLCSKNEYRKATKHGIFSENLKQRTNIFYQHRVNKTGHKKHYAYLSAQRRKNKDTYDFNPIFNRLIKYRVYARYMTNGFINSEIARKLDAESRIYAYCKVTK